MSEYRVQGAEREVCVCGGGGGPKIFNMEVLGHTNLVSVQ